MVSVQTHCTAMDPPQTRAVLTWEALRNRAHVGTLALRVRRPDVVRSRRKRGITRGDVETPIRTVRARASTKWTGAKACRLTVDPQGASHAQTRLDTGRMGPTGWVQRRVTGIGRARMGTGRRVEMIVLESRFEKK